MKKHKKKSSEPEENYQSSSHQIAKHRSYGLAGASTIAAITIGVALYAQAGLLSPPAVPQTGRQQTPQDTRPSPHAAASDSSEQPSLSIPTESTPTETDKSEKKSSVSMPQQPEPATENSKSDLACDEGAKATARQTRDRALEAEKNLHSNNLSSISGIPKLLGKLGLIKNKTAAENLRHRKAVKGINETYKQTVDHLGCAE